MKNRLITDEQFYGQMETEIRAEVIEEIAKEANALINPTQEDLEELKRKQDRQLDRLMKIIKLLKNQSSRYQRTCSVKVLKDQLPLLLNKPHDFIQLYSMSQESLLQRSSELYSDGFSLNAISVELKVPKSTIRSVLIKMGIELRAHSRKKYDWTKEKYPKRTPAPRNAPYGYFLLQGKIQIDTKEQAIIKIILKLHNEGSSQGAIARDLNDMKIKPRKASQWKQVTIGIILKRELHGDHTNARKSSSEA